MKKHWLRGLPLCLSMALLVASAACGSSGETAPEPTATSRPPTGTPIPPSPTPAEEPTDTPIPPAPEPTATPIQAQELPATPSKAVLGADPQTTYKVDMATFQELDFDESELPVPPGTVEAHWYKSGGRYVVAFVGLDLSATGSLCPGGSILTEQGFDFVSNAPTAEGACEGFTTLTTDPEVGPRVCQGTVLYVTAIPSDAEGTLFGSIEMLTDDGAAIIGLTGSVESSPEIPDIELDEFCE